MSEKAQESSEVSRVGSTTTRGLEAGKEEGTRFQDPESSHHGSAGHGVSEDWKELPVQ